MGGAAPQEKIPGWAGREMRRCGERRSGATLFPCSASKSALSRCHLPLPPNPAIPYPTPMPTHTRPTIRRSCEGRDLAPVKGESRGVSPLARGLGDVPPVMKKTSEGGRVGPTNVAMPAQVLPLPLPCFPLSISRHFSPGPTAPVRPAPWQIRLVPLFRPFQLPPAGPSAPHPARAWQIRLVPLCRLVRRAYKPKLESVSSGTEEGKKRAAQFKAIQTARLP